MKDSEHPYAVTFDPDSGLHTESLFPSASPGGPRLRSIGKNGNGEWQIPPKKKKKKKKTSPKKKKPAKKK